MSKNAGDSPTLSDLVFNEEMGNEYLARHLVNEFQTPDEINSTLSYALCYTMQEMLMAGVLDMGLIHKLICRILAIKEATLIIKIERVN